MTQSEERSAWQKTTELLGQQRYTFGPHWSFNFRNDPKRLGFVLSRYKFASKMVGKKKTMLELGCSDGIGASILAENVTSYTGVDLDQKALEKAQQNFTNYTFIHDDFMGKIYGSFEGIVSLDVVEHILPSYEDRYFETVHNNLATNGIVVIGTPNITASSHASKASQLGHVNIFSRQRLVEAIQKKFYHVFPFGMNDEIVHTGFAPMAHYLICVACHKK